MNFKKIDNLTFPDTIKWNKQQNPALDTLVGINPNLSLKKPEDKSNIQLSNIKGEFYIQKVSAVLNFHSFFSFSQYYALGCFIIGFLIFCLIPLIPPGLFSFIAVSCYTTGFSVIGSFSGYLLYKSVIDQTKGQILRGKCALIISLLSNDNKGVNKSKKNPLSCNINTKTSEARVQLIFLSYLQLSAYLITGSILSNLLAVNYLVSFPLTLLWQYATVVLLTILFGLMGTLIGYPFYLWKCRRNRGQDLKGAFFHTQKI